MKKIMIIEDEPDVAETMKMFLEKAGYRVAIFFDPRKGISEMKNHDLLLLDIMMPKMSGRMVLAEMEKEKIKIPTIVVSAVGTPMEVGAQLSREYPGLEFLPKTEIAHDLVNMIKQKIGR